MANSLVGSTVPSGYSELLAWPAGPVISGDESLYSGNPGFLIWTAGSLSDLLENFSGLFDTQSSRVSFRETDGRRLMPDHGASFTEWGCPPPAVDYMSISRSDRSGGPIHFNPSVAISHSWASATLTPVGVDSKSTILILCLTS